MSAHRQSCAVSRVNSSKEARRHACADEVESRCFANRALCPSLTRHQAWCRDAFHGCYRRVAEGSGSRWLTLPTSLARDDASARVTPAAVRPP